MYGLVQKDRGHLGRLSDWFQYRVLDDSHRAFSQHFSKPAKAFKNNLMSLRGRIVKQLVERAYRNRPIDERKNARSNFGSINPRWGESDAEWLISWNDTAIRFQPTSQGKRLDIRDYELTTLKSIRDSQIYKDIRAEIIHLSPDLVVNPVIIVDRRGDDHEIALSIKTKDPAISVQQKIRQAAGQPRIFREEKFVDDASTRFNALAKQLFKHKRYRPFMATYKSVFFTIRGLEIPDSISQAALTDLRRRVQDTDGYKQLKEQKELGPNWGTGTSIHLRVFEDERGEIPKRFFGIEVSSASNCGYLETSLPRDIYKDMQPALYEAQNRRGIRCILK